jgi:hypothetical protein
MTTPPEGSPAADPGTERIDLSQYGNDSLYEHFQRSRKPYGEAIRFKEVQEER